MIKENLDRVKEILIKDKRARDCDNYLLSLIWKQDIAESKEGVFTSEFLEMLSSGKLTNFESIRRTRQKLQADNIELRGDKYKERKEDLEPQVKSEIREVSNSFHERFGYKYEKEEGSMF